MYMREVICDDVYHVYHEYHEYQYVNISIVFLKISWQRQVMEDILPNLICQHIKSLH